MSGNFSGVSARLQINNMNSNKVFKLVASIIICELAGIIGSFFTMSQITNWYVGLNKPSFNPPNWIFGPVWTTLFVLMGISLYLVWSKNWRVKNEIISLRGKRPNALSLKFYTGEWQKANIILIFATQLVLNILWPLIFFGLHAVSIAFVEIIILWFSIIFTMVNFYRVSRASAGLLLPYFLWVSFASFLNFLILLIN